MPGLKPGLCDPRVSALSFLSPSETVVSIKCPRLSRSSLLLLSHRPLGKTVSPSSFHSVFPAPSTDCAESFSSHLIPIRASPGMRAPFYTHFPDDLTWAQRGCLSFLRAHSHQVAEPDSNQGHLIPATEALLNSFLPFIISSTQRLPGGRIWGSVNNAGNI